LYFRDPGKKGEEERGEKGETAFIILVTASGGEERRKGKGVALDHFFRPVLQAAEEEVLVITGLILLICDAETGRRGKPFFLLFLATGEKTTPHFLVRGSEEGGTHVSRF